MKIKYIALILLSFLMGCKGTSGASKAKSTNGREAHGKPSIRAVSTARAAEAENIKSDAPECIKEALLNEENLKEDSEVEINCESLAGDSSEPMRVELRALEDHKKILNEKIEVASVGRDEKNNLEAELELTKRLITHYLSAIGEVGEEPLPGEEENAQIEEELVELKAFGFEFISVEEEEKIEFKLSESELSGEDFRSLVELSGVLGDLIKSYQSLMKVGVELDTMEDVRLHAQYILNLAALPLIDEAVGQMDTTNLEEEISKLAVKYSVVNAETLARAVEDLEKDWVTQLIENLTISSDTEI